MVSLALQLETADAPAVLRSHAYSCDCTGDALVTDLVTGRLAARQLGEDTDRDR